VANLTSRFAAVADGYRSCVELTVLPKKPTHDLQRQLVRRDGLDV